MSATKKSCLAFACILGAQILGYGIAQASPAGVWFNDTGQGAIEIYPCGRSYCGKIIWLKQPISRKTGKPLQDAYNPDPAKRRRPICGLLVIEGVQEQNDGSWDGGRIYDPKVGKSYNVALQLMDRNQLRVTGYVGVRFLGKSFTWTRAPQDLDTCKS